MKKISQIIIMLIVLTIALSGCQNSNETSEKQTLKVALSDDYPPMEFRDENNELVGFDIDLIKALEKQMDVKLEIITSSWDGLFVGLTSDKYDMIISATSITKERLENYEQSIPYLASGQVVVVNKNSAISKSDDLIDKKIGVQIDSTGEQAANKQKEQTNFEIIAYDEVISVFSDIKAGRLDGGVCDYGVAMEYVANNPDDYYITDIQLTNEPLAVTIKKGNTQLKDKVNTALSQLKENGELKSISQKWFKEDYTSNINEEIK